ncbi:MAG: carboxypeptidase regulatory-like domain-containing protein [Pirellulaceae bacterium]|nr:carboxypeptidase regulatory-like domain-containing protein [Pirellulaceae bacterium]
MYFPLFTRFLARTILPCACILFPLLAGCGGDNRLPPLVQVTGQVTLDGNPIAEGNVVFVPDASKGHSGPMSMSLITNGQYRIRTVGKDGVPAGWYTVIVEDSQRPIFADGGSKKGPPIPPDYRTAEKSPLKIEVKPGEETINLELKSGR